MHIAKTDSKSTTNKENNWKKLEKIGKNAVRKIGRL